MERRKLFPDSFFLQKRTMTEGSGCVSVSVCAHAYCVYVGIMYLYMCTCMCVCTLCFHGCVHVVCMCISVWCVHMGICCICVCPCMYPYVCVRVYNCDCVYLCIVYVWYVCKHTHHTKHKLMWKVGYAVVREPEGFFAFVFGLF